MIFRPKVSRDAASIITDAQAQAIEATRIVCETQALAEASMLLRLGIRIEEVKPPQKEYDHDEYLMTHESRNDVYPDAEDGP